MIFGLFQHSSHYVLNDTSPHSFIPQDPASVSERVDWAAGMKCFGALEYEGGFFLSACHFPLTEARTLTMHEARLKKLPPGEFIEKLVSISVPDITAEFLPMVGKVLKKHFSEC